MHAIGMDLSNPSQIEKNNKLFGHHLFIWNDVKFKLF